MEKIWISIQFYLGNGTLSTLEFPVQEEDEILTRFRELIDPPEGVDLNQIRSIKIVPACEACRINQPSQWAHMECEHGCLKS